MSFPLSHLRSSRPLGHPPTRLHHCVQCSDDYVYHGTACPWLQVRLLRLLQFFPIPATEAMRVRLNEVVGHILNKTEVTKVCGVCGARVHCVLYFIQLTSY